MNLEELRALVSKGEDSRQQFKEDINNVDKLAVEIVAFANSQGVKAVYFAGNKITDSQIICEDFEGTLTQVFQGSLSFIMRNIRKIQKQKGVNTIGEPEIPPIVLEELLVNALIHRDYFITAPIRLFIFEDRIEIINPGYLPNHLTVEKIMAGNSIQRNPIITSFAAKGLLPYRGLGTGIRRALQDWPEIKFINNRDDCLFTSIVLRKPI